MANEKLTLIKKLSNKDIAEVKFWFSQWVQTSEGFKDCMALDTWHSFPISNGGSVDLHFLYDETLELYIYPCNSVNTETIGNVITSTIKPDYQECVVIKEKELQRLMPKSLVMYIKEQTDWKK